MSDLAPFVAATLRDKVVDDMNQEIQELQRRLTYSQTIEIVSNRGGDDNVIDHNEEKIYFTGLFQDGQHQAQCSRLNVPYRKASRCPLGELPNLFIRIGGIHKATLRAVAHNGYMRDEDMRDTATSKYMKFQGADLVLEFEIHDWPREQWTPLVEIGHILRGDNLLNNLVQASQQCPQAFVVFYSITVLTKQIRSAMQNALPPPARRKFQEEIEEEKKQQRYKDYVEGRMRALGYEGRIRPLHRGEIIDALAHILGIYNAENDRDKKIIDRVIKIHKKAQSEPDPDQSFHDEIEANAEHILAED